MTVVYNVRTPYTNSADAARAAWVAKLMPGCEASAKRMQCSPEAIVAQAAVETGWGKSTIGNNIFGIKATDNWRGATQTVRTREVINGQSIMMDDKFRDYPSIQLSIDDRLRFLLENTRYAAAGVFTNTSDDELFQDLQRAGYATDPNYANVLSSVCQMVKRYTANMDRVELSDKVIVEPSGNVTLKNIKDSDIVKQSNMGQIATTCGAVTAAGAPIVSAFFKADWKVAAIFGVVTVVAILVAAFYLFKNKQSRKQMHEDGVA